MKLSCWKAAIKAKQSLLRSGILKQGLCSALPFYSWEAEEKVAIVFEQSDYYSLWKLVWLPQSADGNLKEPWWPGEIMNITYKLFKSTRGKEDVLTYVIKSTARIWFDCSIDYVNFIFFREHVTINLKLQNYFLSFKDSGVVILIVNKKHFFIKKWTVTISETNGWSSLFNSISENQFFLEFRKKLHTYILFGTTLYLKTCIWILRFYQRVLKVYSCIVWIY